MLWAKATLSTRFEACSFAEQEMACTGSDRVLRGRAKALGGVHSKSPICIFMQSWTSLLSERKNYGTSENRFIAEQNERKR